MKKHLKRKFRIIKNTKNIVDRSKSTALLFSSIKKIIVKKTD